MKNGLKSLFREVGNIIYLTCINKVKLSVKHVNKVKLSVKHVNKVKLSFSNFFKKRCTKTYTIGYRIVSIVRSCCFAAADRKSAASRMFYRESAKIVHV